MNVLVSLLNLLIWRDKSVVLVGSWMGEKFSDNSRYLYQFLHYNKTDLNLKRVIWVTRNEDLYQELLQMGYEVYKCGTLASFYWHLKSGVHIICNAVYELKNGKFQPDIQTELSFGAKRIQLWHGIAIKSVGAASNEARAKNPNPKDPERSLIRHLLTRGGWDDYYFLSTSEKSREDNFKISRCLKENMWISSYPRNNACLEFLKDEKTVLKEIAPFKKKVIYLPTFRSDYTNYTHPLENQHLLDFIDKNDILWIEKQHSASDFSINDTAKYKNVYFLDEKFDVNILYDYVDAVVSDYSSAVFDAVYKNVPVIMYTPDLENFKNGDVGIFFDLNEYCEHLLVFNGEELISHLNDVKDERYFTKDRLENYKTIMTVFFENRKADYLDFWTTLKSFANL
ncbi:CDP-glycerol glycerophosphotransferase family protein [Streptococcus sp. CSL10205-OR2]|uniref:CDP-glycerol glycerophosphotransferase family protein n=1 Tax=Streptococcus sp. CSL10205-OR2 TaxID=2980558 RepID=UPI0021DA8776|nr:CDP-glycerol glycerophosphotransferase family protein [Streptococcus sp. CSL10205-OR2]MCU9533615.1 CDP-glycerol glycerophosphotransferase family protein [Streptococcus sp. CSL10205-OR2]